MMYRHLYKNYSLDSIKKQLMSEINQWIEQSSLRQIDAAQILNITRPRVSDLVNEKTDKFSVDALIKLLERTGHQVMIAVSDISGEQA